MFPSDIYSYIATYCRMGTLKELALVSRQLRTEAQRLVFRDVVLSLLDDNHIARSRQLSGLLRQNPTLSTYVRTLHIQFSPLPLQFTNEQPLLAILKRLANTPITSLALQFWGSTSSDDPMDWHFVTADLRSLLESTMSKSSIRSLELKCIACPLGQWLTSCPNVQHLHLTNMMDREEKLAPARGKRPASPGPLRLRTLHVYARFGAVLLGPHPPRAGGHPHVNWGRLTTLSLRVTTTPSEAEQTFISDVASQAPNLRVVRSYPDKLGAVDQRKERKTVFGYFPPMSLKSLSDVTEHIHIWSDKGDPYLGFWNVIRATTRNGIPNTSLESVALGIGVHCSRGWTVQAEEWTRFAEWITPEMFPSLRFVRIHINIMNDVPGQRDHGLEWDIGVAGEACQKLDFGHLEGSIESFRVRVGWGPNTRSFGF